jgi:hypothetical protein
VEIGAFVRNSQKFDGIEGVSTRETGGTEDIQENSLKKEIAGGQLEENESQYVEKEEATGRKPKRIIERGEKRKR